ncbi:DUF808 family protein [Edwardsiella ictaluri]
MQQVLVLCGMALVMTLGVYGLVRADRGTGRRRGCGYARDRVFLRAALARALLNAAPWPTPSALSVVGTAAMFMVGGGIVVHGLPGLHHGIAALSPSAVGLPERWGVAGRHLGHRC